MFSPDDMDDFHDLERTKIALGGFCQMFCVVLQYFSFWQRLELRIVKKEVMNDKEGEEV